MSRLDVERFFDFGVWRSEEIEEDSGGYEEGKESVCGKVQHYVDNFGPAQAFLKALYLSNGASRPLSCSSELMLLL